MNVLIVSDFTYPRLGGVEVHISHLAHNLAKVGGVNSVTVLTRHDDVVGERWSTNPQHSSDYDVQRNVCSAPPVLYIYTPMPTMGAGTSLVNFTVSYAYFHDVILRRRINVVHTHASTSVMSLEVSLYCRLLSLPMVHTEHSLFPLNDIATLNLSAAQSYLSGGRMQLAIGVSAVAAACYSSRTGRGVGKVRVVKNAIDNEGWGRKRTGNKRRVRVATLSRLTYRKGTDLLVSVIPTVCSLFPEVDWVVGGEGKKETLVREAVEIHGLEDRVEFLGRVEQGDVKEVLGGVDVFLNTSLTESFCLSVLEAKASGCVIVTTDVGGVREVFDYQGGGEGVVYVDVAVSEVVEGLRKAIDFHKKLMESMTREDTAARWRGEVMKEYGWERVAKEVIEVYKEVLEQRRLGEESMWDIFDSWGAGRTFLETVISVGIGIAVAAVMRVLAWRKGKWKWEDPAIR